MTGLAECPRHAGDVREPRRAATRIERVERNLARLVERHRVHSQPAIVSRTERDRGVAVDGHGQNPAVVVVGVVADQVDAAGGDGDPDLAATTEVDRERVVDAGHERRVDERRNRHAEVIADLMLEGFGLRAQGSVGPAVRLFPCKNLRDRAEALIRIAAPQFRAELEAQEKERKLLP